MSTIGRYTTLLKIPLKIPWHRDFHLLSPNHPDGIQWLAPLVAFDQIQVQDVVLREGL